MAGLPGQTFIVDVDSRAVFVVRAPHPDAARQLAAAQVRQRCNGSVVSPERLMVRAPKPEERSAWRKLAELSTHYLLAIAPISALTWGDDAAEPSSC